MIVDFAWKVVNSCGISLCVEKCMRGDSIFHMREVGILNNYPNFI